MTHLKVFDSSSSVNARTTPGAVMTAGLKRAGGGFVDGSTDRFWFGLPNADKNSSRQSHPDFARFNVMKGDRKGSTLAQASMRCILAHADLQEARNIERSCYRGPVNDPRVRNPEGPGPWCHGDGSQAERWNAQTGKYESIACLDDDCLYAEYCAKFRLVLFFVPRWDGTIFEDAGMPQVLTRYVSKGRRMSESFEGMIAYARAQAQRHEVGEIDNWYGFPFRMLLSKRTGKKVQTRKGMINSKYTDVTFTADGDLYHWLAAQRERRALIAETSAGLLASRTPEIYGDEEDAVSPLAIKPANVSAGLTEEEKRAIEAEELAATQQGE